MPRIHRTRTDARLNPALQEQVGTLRGSMLDAAERHPLPPGFVVEPMDRPSARLVHEESGRSHVVPFYAYSAVRKAFSEMFPEGMQATFGNGSRFGVRDNDGATEIVDSVTGRAVEVPLYAMRDILETAKVIGDNHLTERMRFEASLENVIELAGATLTRADYPSNSDPAYRITDADGEEIGWLHFRTSHWAVIDFERFGREDFDANAQPERIPYAEKKTLKTALDYVANEVAKTAAPRP